MEIKELNDVYSDLSAAPANPEISKALEDLGIPTEKSTPSPEKQDDKVVVPDSGSTEAAKQPEPESEGVSWDSFIDEPKTESVETKSQVDWAEVGKAINITSEIKGSEDVVSYVSDLRKQIDELKAKSIGDDLPKELVEALEIAKSGGDYRTFLDVADYDFSQDKPEDLFEDEMAELFYNQDGSFREDEFNDYMDSVPLVDKKMRGLQIQRELIIMQEQQKNQLKQKVAAEKAENLRKLERSLNDFNKVGDFDVTPKVKKQLFNDLATGAFLAELGISSNGSHNWDKLKETYFKAKYFDTIQKFNSNQAVKQDKRAALTELNNSTVTKTGRPENATETVKRSGIDLYLQEKIK